MTKIETQDIALNWEEILRLMLVSRASWELVTQTIEERIGSSTIEHSVDCIPQD